MRKLTQFAARAAKKILEWDGQAPAPAPDPRYVAALKDSLAEVVAANECASKELVQRAKQLREALADRDTWEASAKESDKEVQDIEKRLADAEKRVQERCKEVGKEYNARNLAEGRVRTLERQYAKQTHELDRLKLALTRDTHAGVVMANILQLVEKWVPFEPNDDKGRKAIDGQDRREYYTATREAEGQANVEMGSWKTANDVLGTLRAVRNLAAKVLRKDDDGPQAK